MRKVFLTHFLLLATLFLWSCSKTSDIVPESKLVSATLVGEFEKGTIDARFQGNAIVSAITKHGIKVYRVVYKTQDLAGKEVQASGALIVPKTTTFLGLLSQQHGTIFSDSQAPSYYGSNSEAFTIGSLVGSTGYIVSCPDYLGYGAANNMPHPYQHAKSLASASLDMLRASRDFLQKEGISVPTKLFLTGYSEGGFANMALHKKIQEENAEFTVTASASGAGAYNTTKFVQFVASQNTKLPSMSLYLWVIQAYNQIYNLNRPFSAYLNEPFAAQAQSGGFAAVSEQNPQVLFKKEFIDALKNGTDAPLAAALRDNDIYDWKPTAPVALFHGDADETVPFFNSQDAFNAMKAKGATVELSPIPGGTHISSVSTYILGVYGFFSRF